MKKLGQYSTLILAFALLFHAAAMLFNPAPVAAQAAGPGITLAPQFVPAINQCAWPSGATVTNGVAYCFVYTGTISTSGLYWAVNQGTTWTNISQAPPPSGVATFNGRTGNVQLTDADILAAGTKVVTTSTSVLQ